MIKSLLKDIFIYIFYTPRYKHSTFIVPTVFLLFFFCTLRKYKTTKHSQKLRESCELVSGWWSMAFISRKYASYHCSLPQCRISHWIHGLLHTQLQRDMQVYTHMQAPFFFCCLYTHAHTHTYTHFLSPFLICFPPLRRCCVVLSVWRLLEGGVSVKCVCRGGL